MGYGTVPKLHQRRIAGDEADASRELLAPRRTSGASSPSPSTSPTGGRASRACSPTAAASAAGARWEVVGRERADAASARPGATGTLVVTAADRAHELFAFQPRRPSGWTSRSTSRRPRADRTLATVTVEGPWLIALPPHARAPRGRIGSTRCARRLRRGSGSRCSTSATTSPRSRPSSSRSSSASSSASASPGRASSRTASGRSSTSRSTT